MAELMTPQLVRLDADLGGSKEEVIAALAAVVADAGRADDVAVLERDLLAREAKAATGMKDGIAIPHCRTAAVTVPTVAFARLAPAVDFGAKDGPAELVFLIAAPEGGGNTHLQILTKLARSLVKPEFTDALRTAASPEDVVAIVGGVVDDAPAAPTTPAASTPTLGPPAGWWPSPPARPASHTPTWPPRRSRPRPVAPASTSPSRPRARPARSPSHRRRSTRRTR